MKHFGDIIKINGAEVPMVDIITGGSPCQDLSVAGKRAGLKHSDKGDEETTRSGLFMEQIRIVKEMRDECIRQLRVRGADVDIRLLKPRFIVWENVAGAFSSNKGEDFRCVLEEICRVADQTANVPLPEKGKWSTSGCIVGDGWSVAWRVHDAQFWGVPQRRKRIALVADFGGSSAPKILFESESVSGDSEQSREERKDIATDAQRSIGKAISFQERAGKPGGGKGILIQNERTGALSTLNNQSVVYDASRRHDYQPFDDDICETVQAHYGTGGGNVPIVLNNNECERVGLIRVESFDNYNLSLSGEIAKTLQSEGGGSGVNEGCVLIENHPTDSRVKICEDNIVPTLASRMGTGGNNVPLVLENQEEPILLESNQNHETVQTDGISTTLPASMGMGGGYVPMVFEPVSFGNGQLHDAMSPSIDIAKTLNCMDDPAKIVTYGLDRASFNQGKNAKYDFKIDEEKIGTQVAKGPGAVFQSVVRRLTPMECERLQGYPDGWTDIGDWVDSKGKKHKGDSDSPRYKALGNSIALPFWEWMAERMVQYIDHDPTMASLFDGIGGFPLVFSRCGCSPVWASEIEEFPIAVTKLRFGGE